jgi:competence protein ComEA
MLREFTVLQRLVLAGLGGVIILAAAVIALGRSRALPPSVAPPPAVARTQREWLGVTVTGAVVRPGVYTVRPGARIWEAVQAAGGLTPTADVGRLNLAKPLKNGAAVNIKDKALAAGPAQALRPAASRPTAVPSPASLSATVPLAPPAPRSRAPQPAPAGGTVVSLNTATAAQLAHVPGLDKILAGRIVAYRKAHGGFQRVDDVLLIKGMTPAIFAQAQPYLGP